MIQARFRHRAASRRARLLLLEPQDQSLQSFAGSILGMEAQEHATAGRSAQAVAIQRSVVRHYGKALGSDRRAPALNRLAIAHVTLANIARQAGDRTQACNSLAAASAAIVELKKRDKLLGFVGRYEAGIAANLGLCRGGASLGQLRVLE